MPEGHQPQMAVSSYPLHTLSSPPPLPLSEAKNLVEEAEEDV